MNLKTIFLSEMLGTSMLVLLGCGVIANVLLFKTKGNDNKSLMINLGWGIAVFIAIYVAYKSGAHLNPAVTLGIAVSGIKEYVPGINVTFSNTIIYILAQLIGSFIGSILCYLTYKKHFDLDKNYNNQFSIFATSPAIRSYKWNVLTELIATFVLVSTILSLPAIPSGLGPLAVAILVIGIGLSLGGPTGYAINPARDLGPRIAYELLYFNKEHKISDWSYAWVPIIGPLMGGLLAGCLSHIAPIIYI